MCVANRMRTIPLEFVQFGCRRVYLISYHSIDIQTMHLPFAKENYPIKVSFNLSIYFLQPNCENYKITTDEIITWMNFPGWTMPMTAFQNDIFENAMLESRRENNSWINENTFNQSFSHSLDVDKYHNGWMNKPHFCWHSTPDPRPSQTTNNDP